MDSKRFSFSTFIAIVLAAALALTAGWLAGEKDRVLVYVLSSDAVSLDPLKATDSTSLKIIAQIYEGLMKFRPGSLEVEPNLAIDYLVSKDGLVYTFDLQRNVMFQDGTPFDADAVIWNYNRAKAALSSSYYASLVWQNVQSVEKVSRYRVRFVLKHVDASFLTDLALPIGGSMVSPNVSDAGFMPIGTGPYKLVNWQRGKSIVLEYNQGWWQDKLARPYFKGIRFTVVSDAAQALSMAEQGKADILDNVPPQTAQTIGEGKDIKILETNALTTAFLGFNTTHGVFSNPKVRQALKLLIDRQEIIDDVYDDLAMPANGPLPPVLNRQVVCRDLAANKEAGKQMLQELGFTATHPLSFTVEIPLEPRDYLPTDGMAMGNELRSQFESTGLISVSFVYKPFEQIIEDLEAGSTDAFVLGWSSDNGQVSNFLKPLFYSSSSLNFFKYHNKAVDTYLDEADMELNPDKQRMLYRMVCEQFLDDPPAIFLSYPFSYKVVNTNLKGVNINPMDVEELYLLRY